MSPSLETKSGSVWVLVNVGAGLKNGVWNSSWRIGESSEGSLFRVGLWVLDPGNEIDGGFWYGDPQLAV